jgi:hypothetical protein
MIHSAKRRAQWRAYYHRHKKERRAYIKGRPELRAFIDAKYRCTTPEYRQYKDYGGRGIKFLLGSWLDIIASIGHRPSKEYTLDRIDNDGHYEIGNLRWATRKEQIQNRRISLCH